MSNEWLVENNINQYICGEGERNPKKNVVNVSNEFNFVIEKTHSRIWLFSNFFPPLLMKEFGTQITPEPEKYSLN